MIPKFKIVFLICACGIAFCFFVLFSVHLIKSYAGFEFIDKLVWISFPYVSRIFVLGVQLLIKDIIFTIDNHLVGNSAEQSSHFCVVIISSGKGNQFQGIHEGL